MYKPGPNFKIPKQVKRTMATMVNADERNDYKRSMIQAILFEQNTRPKSKKEKSE